MRGLRSVVALIVVLAGLSAYIYFITSKKPENDAGPKQEKVFASVQADKIDDLRITSESGDTTALKKGDAGWRLVEPASVGADESEVSGITNALTQLEIVRVVDENPVDLKEYGLAGPRIEVDFKATGDKDSRRLLVGDKSPTGADLFAKRNDEKRVFLIAAFQEQTFNRSTFDLRDKTVIKFDRDKVDGLEVNEGGKSLQIAKEGGEWKITKPLKALADLGSVEGLIGRVQTARMKSFVTSEPSAADLKTYGLDKPDITLQVNAGSAKATLLVGGKADDNTVYARDASKSAVVTMDTTLADDLKKKADEYRRKDIFAFRAYTANRIEMTRNGQTVAFEKAKAEGKDAGTGPEKWRRVSPNAGDIDNDKVAALLAKLEGMRALSFVESTAKTGLESPAMTVVAKFEDGKKEDRVIFGKSGDNVYAERQGEPGAAKIDAAEFNDANSKLDELSK
jgi:hypothetical protein